MKIDKYKQMQIRSRLFDLDFRLVEDDVNYTHDYAKTVSNARLKICNELGISEKSLRNWAVKLGIDVKRVWIRGCKADELMIY